MQLRYRRCTRGFWSASHLQLQLVALGQLVCTLLGCLEALREASGFCLGLYGCHARATQLCSHLRHLMHQLLNTSGHLRTERMCCLGTRAINLIAPITRIALAPLKQPLRIRDSPVV
jgi:hypothetical protein